MAISTRWATSATDIASADGTKGIALRADLTERYAENPRPIS
jgi:hypothetical protein